MFDLADMWARRTGEMVRLVSANDHVHSRKSAHYEGRALDLHSSSNSALARFFRAAGYAVLWNVPGHFGHVHVEARSPDAPLLAPQETVSAPPARSGDASASGAARNP